METSEQTVVAGNWHDPAFTVVQTPVVPLLASPADRSTSLPTSLTLKWRSVVGALAYHVQLASDSIFTSGVMLNDSTIVGTSHASGQLANSITYFWRVRVRTSDLTSAFSFPWRFKTLLPLPTQVQQTCPAAGTSANVKLTVLNTLGQEVALLQNGEQEAGYHEVKFDGNGRSSGFYFYRLHAGTFVETKRLLLLR